MLDELLCQSNPSGAAVAVRLFGVLIAIVLGLLVSVVLMMRLIRRRHEPAPPRRGASDRDPWLESGRRLDADDG